MIKFTEEELKEIELRQAHEGFSEYQLAFFDTAEYKKLRNIILDGLPKRQDSRLNFKICNIDDVISAGKLVIDKHAGDIDIRVPYVFSGKLDTHLIEKFGKNPAPKDYKEIVKFIKNNVDLRKVTDIPLNFSRTNIDNGYSRVTYFYTPNEVNLEFYKMLPYVTFEIGLNGLCTELTKSIYVHEMYHALLNRNRGSITNVLNQDMLPIFMENVSALDLDETKELLKKVTLDRLLKIKNNIILKTNNDYNDINHLDSFMSEMYIASTLSAYSLFNIYENGTTDLRKQIDENINDVLMGNGTIEDVLDKYEVTLEDGSQIVKQKVKKFSK